MNPQDIIELPRTLATDILAHAQQGGEKEICGLISINHDNHGEKFHHYPIPNIAKDPQHRYDMEPQGLIAAMRDMRQRNHELFAIYHSHPSSPAQPSITDLKEAHYPDAVYLIISLNTKGVVEIRAFRLLGNQSNEIPLVLY